MRDASKQSSPVTRTARVTNLEKQLETALERYELVWQATNDIIYDLDLRTGAILWNNTLHAHFGYPKNEPTDTLSWWIEHIHPDDALGVEKALYEWFVSSQNAWRAEYRFRKADGTYRYVLDRGYVSRANDGSPLRIIGTLLDITQQKELERAKDEFISLVSHQLRTPLTVIRVYGEMFAGGLLGPLSDAQASHIARMTDASVRLIRLVDDILNVSRVEMGTFTIRREWLDLNQLIVANLEDVRPLADTKHITLSYPANPELPNAYLDPEIMKQVLENLLANAIRYTLAAIGSVQVSTVYQGGEVIISVQDNGIGIPRAEQKRIFERFYRANNAVNIEEHGTGLGLYLVRVLVTALGGRIWFESTKKGTTFFVALPLQ